MRCKFLEHAEPMRWHWPTQAGHVLAFLFRGVQVGLKAGCSEVLQHGKSVRLSPWSAVKALNHPKSD